MYDLPHFRETRPEVLEGVIRARPLATLVVAAAQGFEVNHVPCMLAAGAPAPGTLHAHVSRANPLVRIATAGVPAVAVFSAGQGYVSPSWYPAKAEHGRVVPTWNYVVVHAHGVLRPIDDVEWLRAQVTALTHQQESPLEAPWAPADAPADYVESQLRGIVGLELVIARIEGKWKLGQNRSEADRRGVIDQLASEAPQPTLADAMRRSLADPAGDGDAQRRGAP